MADEYEEIFNDGFLLNFKRNTLHTIHNPSDAVYNGSSMNMRSLCRYLLCLKSAIGLGEYAFCSIVGSIVSFLPRDYKVKGDLQAVVISAISKEELLVDIEQFMMATVAIPKNQDHVMNDVIAKVEDVKKKDYISVSTRKVQLQNQEAMINI